MKRYWNWALSQWDRVIGWMSVGAGALLTLTGALNVSRAPDQLDQLSYLATGPAIGLFLLGVGAILILSADLRDDWAKLDEIAAALGSRNGGDGAPPRSGVTVEIALPETPVATLRVGLPVLAVAGMGLVVAAAGANRSFERATALHWTRLSAVSLALALATVVFCYRRGRGAITRGIAAVSSGAVGTATATSGTAVGHWYVVEGSQRYHAAGCDLLRFSEIRPIRAEEATRAGLTRCPLCR
ncbi:MAG: hypothetical protein AB1679_26210 [Actinomycetota bacterium]